MKQPCAKCGNEMYIYKPYTTFLCKKCQKKEQESKVEEVEMYEVKALSLTCKI